MPNPTHPTVDDSHRQPMEGTSEGRNGNRDGQFRARTTDRISCDGSDKAGRMRLLRSSRIKRKSRSPHESTSDESCSEQDDNLRIFSETTTLHGLRDVILSTSICLKIVWTIILFFALLLTLQGCYEVLKEYSKKSVVISYFIQKKTSMKLPDLIICPFNRFNLSYLQEMNISEPLSQYLELTYPTIMYHRFQLLRAEEIMVNSDLYDEQLQSILRQNNLNFSDFIQRASLNCPAFFPLRECTEDDDESCINPCSEATEMYTSAGRCFRFPSSIQNASGYGHGYSIIVNLPYELYHTGVNQILNDGILVKLVGDGKGVNYDMSLIPAGVHAIIPLTATRYDFMNDPPRYECEEDPFDAYSSLHCFESCVHHGITEDKCKCSLVASVNPKRYDTCTAKVIRACVIPEFYNPDQHLQIEKCNIKCKPPCKSWAFTKQLSYAPLSTNMVSKLTNGTQKESLKRTIILDIFYEQLEYTTIKHVVAMPLPSLIAQIGGQFSLWAGGSLISLCQIVIYCSRFIFNRCSSKSSSCAKRKSRRKRRSRNCPLEKCDSGATKTNNKISNGGVEMKDKKCAPIAEIVDGGGADSQSSLSDKGLMTEEQLI